MEAEIGTYRIGAVEIATTNSCYPAALGKIIHTINRKFNFITIEIEGMPHLIDMHPAFPELMSATWQTDFEPIGLALEYGDFVTLTGTVSGEAISGAISANGFSCNGIPFQVNGTYEAMRVPAAAKAAHPTGISVMESLRGAIN